MKERVQPPTAIESRAGLQRPPGTSPLTSTVTGLQGEKKVESENYMKKEV
jgi:hypothetical protein